MREIWENRPETLRVGGPGENTRHAPSGAFQKLLEIFQNVSCNFSKKLLKKQSKVVFVTKVAEKLLQNTKTFFGLMLKYANCTTKVRFL